jgi:hypothetical protein
MKKLTCLLVGASLLAIAGGVSAEPMTLSVAQMDGVNAGGMYIPQGIALGNGGAEAVSNLLGLTASNALLTITPQLGVVTATTFGQSSATSSYTIGSLLNGAWAVSSSNATAQLF